MRLGKDLISKLIISVSDGQSLGKVKGVYLNNDLTTIAGILVNYEGFLKRQPVVVPRSEIVLFGEDVILITNPEAIVRSDTMTEQFEQWHHGDTVVNRPIETPGGTKVATIGDIILNNETEIVGFTLSRIFVDGPVAQNKAIFNNAIVDLGTESGIMKVDLARAEKQMIDEHPQESDNVLVTQFAAAKESVSDLFTQAKEEVTELTDMAEESSSELIAEVTETAEESSSELIAEVTETAEESSSELIAEVTEAIDETEEIIEQSVSDTIDMAGDKLEEVESELIDLSNNSDLIE